MAGLGINNWAYEKGNVTDKDRSVLEHAKRLEQKKAKNGCRWIKLNERVRVFVQCDKDGNPTKEGKRQIDIIKEMQGIK